MSVQPAFDPVWIEEAVFFELHRRQAAGDMQAARDFRHAWNGAYESGGLRENNFQQIAWRYFQQLGLHGLIADRFGEFPRIQEAVKAAVVRRAWSRKEERVELYAQAVSGKTLLIALQVGRLSEPEGLIAFLRSELMHVSDMLDPAFGYDPHPQLGGSCEPEDDLIRERCWLLWSIFVDARMRRRGWRADCDASARRKQFEQAFSAWPSCEQQAVYSQLVSGGRQTQAGLIAWANNRQLTRPLGEGGAVCPLCGFPTRSGVCSWEGEWAAVAQAIQEDYPQWVVAHGVCTQCADLYRARITVLR